MQHAHLFIIFGATGDLMQRKLLPALYDLVRHAESGSRTVILGCGRSALSDEAFRDQAATSLAAAGLPREAAETWCADTLFYQSLGKQEESDFDQLAARVTSLEAEFDLPGNRIFYLSLPPFAFEGTIIHLGTSGLSHSETGWTRLVIEKPFGQDLDSARRLNEIVHRHFREDQIYRIDHYLGKETVQNLMVFRFGNAIFESIWNREHIERVDVTVAETLGVGERAGYYDGVGALRDMVQNHLSQLLTLTAMEVPASTSADSIRFEKIKVLQSALPIDHEDVHFGQYTRGKIGEAVIPGYREEPGVAADSVTETFVSLLLQINNWRWQGVPFYLTSGKRLPEQFTRISVTFRRPPVAFFRKFDDCRLAPNVLHVTLQPNEGFSLGFEVKQPGSGYHVQTQHLRFRYEEAFGALPDAYRTLLEDVVVGDQTLFVHADEVEASWRLFTPLLGPKQSIQFYSAGTMPRYRHSPSVDSRI